MTRTYSKETAGYWRSRVQLLPYTDSEGNTHPGRNYSIRLQTAGRREYFALGTGNKERAAERASEVYALVRAGKVDEARSRFSDRKEIAPHEGFTIGQYLSLVREKGGLLGRTRVNYENCLKTILSEVLGLPKSKERFSYRTKGNSAWADKILSLPLGSITQERVRDWMNGRISAAGSNPRRRQSATRTASTYVRCARSLFSEPLVAKLGAPSLPSPLPFRGIKLSNGGSMRYQSKMDVQLLIVAAKKELKEARPEAYKTFLLGLFAGLRRGEIDSLEWRMVDLANCRIHLENTEYLHLKTNDSEATVDVDSELGVELRDLKRASSGRFVVESPLPAKPPGARPYYRCQPVFHVLTEWLRSKGITTNKPLHELRKELGALVATKHGIYAASRVLRHSDIGTTARHYADQKQRVSVGLGALLQDHSPSVAAA